MKVLSVKESDTIVKLGRQAACMGASISSCRYKERSEQRDLWRSGWCEYTESVQSERHTNREEY